MHVGMSLVEVLCQVEEVYRMLQSQGLPPEKLVTLRLVTPEPTAATVPLPSAPSVKCCDFWFAANLHKHRITSPDSQALIGFSCVMI